MNTRALIATGMVCATALTIASLITSAGPLNPPAGPIAPTNKTLQEVEPRIPIGPATTPGDADSLFKITQPGSYYLTGNITGVAGKSGVEIAASGVTLDLNGFSLQGVVGSFDGVHGAGLLENLRIRNGVVREWGASGVDIGGSTNSSLRGLLSFGNATNGLRSGPSSVVEACTAHRNGFVGIVANGGSTVRGNATSSNGHNGIFAATGSTVISNTTQSNGASGIVVGSGSTVIGNTASFNSGDGVEVDSNALVLSNNFNSNGDRGDGAGLLVTGSDNRIAGNNVTDNDRGIDIDGPGNLIIGNSASGNTVNYDIAADNRYGPIIDITATGTPAVAGSAAAGTVNTTDPWANFSF